MQEVISYSMFPVRYKHYFYTYGWREEGRERERERERVTVRITLCRSFDSVYTELINIIFTLYVQLLQCCAALYLLHEIKIRKNSSAGLKLYYKYIIAYSWFHAVMIMIIVIKNFTALSRKRMLYH